MDLDNPTVSCTNGQKGSINGNTLTVSNVKSATTCTVTYKQMLAGTDYLITRVNTDGLVRINQPSTVQTPELVEYRYSGSNDVVKNYVNFNNERWRIIGVFEVDDGTGTYENRLKIIREESIGKYSWDTSNSSINYGDGINQWGAVTNYTGAHLMKLLNPGYESLAANNSLYWNNQSGKCYNEAKNANISCDFTSIGLKNDAKEMIEDAKWYNGSINENVLTNTAYKEERSNNIPTIAIVGTSIKQTTSWIGKVAIPYLSDYGYASKDCYLNTTLYNYNLSKCTDSNWLFNNEVYWTLGAESELPRGNYRVDNTGEIGSFLTHGGYGVRPAVYLKANAKITSGTGTSSNPYQLSL